MKNVRKLSVLLTLLLAVSLLFTACNNAGNSGTAATTTTAALTTTQAAASKTVTVKVVNGTQETPFTINTDEEFLRGALESIDLVAGTESEYGLFVTTVNGVQADDSKQEWWCFTKGGESLMTGVDTTPIADGDTFEITLTTGY